MSSGRPHTHRRPINIDDDGAIDFSAVTKAAVTRPAVPPALAHSTAGETAERQQEQPTPLQAVDPRLSAYTHRAAPRRRVAFGGVPLAVSALDAAAAPHPTPSGVVTINNNNNNNNNSNSNGGATSVSAGSKELLDAFWREDAAQKEKASCHTRQEKYEQQLQALWQGGAAGSADDSTSAAAANAGGPLHRPYSLLDRFFADGIPDVEPWDMWALSMPRYGSANISAAALDREHHPVLPETHYSRHYQHRAEERPVVVKTMKTREELRAERRDRLQKAKDERERAKKAARQQRQFDEDRANNNTLTTAAATSSLSLLGTTAKDRLTNSNLRFNLFGDSVMNPLSTENKIFSQYQERFLDHQRRNHERHVAAIPQQIEKRKRDLRRHAEEYPVLRAYRIYPIFTPAHLGKLRNFANDGLLRGFVLWVARCDALVVLTGGEVAVRHLERWILEKMKWECAETTAARLMTCPLQDADTFSFVSTKSRKRGRPLSEGKNDEKEVKTGLNMDQKKREDGGEHVYMNFVDTLQEAESFMCSVPTEGPWRDLSHVWRAAVASGVGRGP